MFRSGVIHELTNNERIRAMSADIWATKEVVIKEDRVIITNKVMANPMVDGSTEVIKSFPFGIIGS